MICLFTKADSFDLHQDREGDNKRLKTPNEDMRV